MRITMKSLTIVAIASIILLVLSGCDGDSTQDSSTTESKELAESLGSSDLPDPIEVDKVLAQIETQEKRMNLPDGFCIPYDKSDPRYDESESRYCDNYRELTDARYYAVTEDNPDLKSIPANGMLRSPIAKFFWKNQGEYQFERDWQQEHENMLARNDYTAILERLSSLNLRTSRHTIHCQSQHSTDCMDTHEFKEIQEKTLPKLLEDIDRLFDDRQHLISQFQQFLNDAEKQAETLIQNHIDAEEKSLEIAKNTEIAQEEAAEKCRAERELRAKADYAQGDDRASYPPMSPFDWNDSFESVIDKICSLESIPSDATIRIESFAGLTNMMVERYAGNTTGFTKSNLCGTCDLAEVLIPNDQLGGGGFLLKVNEKTLFVAPAVIHVDHMKIAGYPFDAKFYFTTLNDYPNLNLGFDGKSSDWGWECPARGTDSCGYGNSEFSAELGVGYYLEHSDKLSSHTYSQQKYSQFKTDNRYLNIKFYTDTGSDGILPLDEEIFFAMPLTHVSVRSSGDVVRGPDETDTDLVARYNAYFKVCESLEAKAYPRKLLGWYRSHESRDVDCSGYKDIDPNDQMKVFGHSSISFSYRPTEALQKSYLDSTKASGWGVKEPSNEGIEDL